MNLVVLKKWSINQRKEQDLFIHEPIKFNQFFVEDNIPHEFAYLSDYLLILPSVSTNL